MLVTKKTIKFAYERDVSINEALRILNDNTSKRISQTSISTNKTNVEEVPTPAKWSEIEKINSKLNMLANTPDLNPEITNKQRRIETIETNLNNPQTQVEPLFSLAITVNELEFEVQSGWWKYRKSPDSFNSRIPIPINSYPI